MFPTQLKVVRVRNLSRKSSSYFQLGFIQFQKYLLMVGEKYLDKDSYVI